MNRFKAKFYEVESAAAGELSAEERRERLKVYVDSVYATLPANLRRAMPQIREHVQDICVTVTSSHCSVLPPLFCSRLFNAIMPSNPSTIVLN